MPSTYTVLPPLHAQVERLIGLGVHELAGVPAPELRSWVPAGSIDGLLVLHPDRIPVSALAPLMRHGDRDGFVVADMTDVDDFRPVPEVTLPAAPVYVLRGPRRHDEMLNWSPEEAMPAIAAAGRTPLTLGEGVHWLLQCPGVLERGRCFMTIGSRLRRPNGSLDARTPAIWISNGTGRDGRERRDAPKVGWCWAGNRHTWLGFASARERSSPDVGERETDRGND
jgi:hypothetical protein